MRNRWYDPQSEILLTQDPIGLAGGVNLYTYAGNNPIGFSDPFGLCKKATSERPCKSRDEAAKKAMRSIYVRSVRENVEYGGEIVGRMDGTFSYVEPRRGTREDVDVYTATSGYEGYYHSHGGYDPDLDSEQISSCQGAADPCESDKKISDSTGKPAYVVTPSGRMLRYDPDPAEKENGTVTEIGNTYTPDP